MSFLHQPKGDEPARSPKTQKKSNIFSEKAAHSEQSSVPLAVDGRDKMGKIPRQSANRSLRQSAMLQMQRTHGNAFVSRQKANNQRQDGVQTEEDGATAGGPAEITDGAGVVRVAGGNVEINGGMINVNAGMTRVSGMLQTDTLLTDSVIASSYSPGAGNIW